jgi:hypothetical protein
MSAHQNSNKNMFHFPTYKVPVQSVPALQNYLLQTNKQNSQFHTLKMLYQHYSFILELHHSLQSNVHHLITCVQPTNCVFLVPLHFCPLSGVRYDIKEEHVTWRSHPSIHLYQQPSVRSSSVSADTFCLQVVQQVFHENWHPDICYLRVYTNFYLYIPQFLTKMDEIQYRHPSFTQEHIWNFTCSFYIFMKCA